MEHRELEKYEIYIGLKDKETLSEKYTIDDFAKFLSAQCTNKQIGFSLTTQLGGYSHDKGYTTETSLRVTLLGLQEEEVIEIGKALKETINTDTIMITKENCNCAFM